MSVVSNPINPNLMPDPGPNISDTKIEKLLSLEGVDERSRDWLRLALDPFSDEQVHLEGKPTGSTLKTAVYCDPKKIQISKPASIPNGTKWGFQIVTTPFDVPANFFATTMIGNGVQTVAPGSTAPVGHLHVEFFQNDGLDDKVWTNVRASDMYMNLSPSTDFTSRTHRVIGAGFEVRDTTATLYQQGSITTFQSPTCEALGNVFYGDAADPANMKLVPSRVMRMPPNTIAEATILPGSRSWEAKHGLYMVQRLEDLDQMFDVPVSTGFVVMNATNTAGTPVFYKSATNYDSLLSARSTLVSGSFCGAFFAGLGDNSTFLVDYRPYIEVAPSADDVPYVNSATIAPDRCEEALELYVRSIAHMPVGVPASWNDAGDWWKAIKNVFWKVADVASTLPIPVVSTIAQTALSAKKAYKAVKSEVKTQKGKKKKKAVSSS